MQPKTIRLRTYFGVLLGLWTFSVTGLFVNHALHIRQNTKDLAVGAAQAYLNKDQAIRLWASSHGGVYVPVSVVPVPCAPPGWPLCNQLANRQASQ